MQCPQRESTRAKVHLERRSGRKEAQAKAGNVARSEDPATRGEKGLSCFVGNEGDPVGAITSLHVVANCRQEVTRREQGKERRTRQDSTPIWQRPGKPYVGAPQGLMASWFTLSQRWHDGSWVEPKMEPPKIYVPV